MKKPVWVRRNWKRPSWQLILVVVLTVLAAIYLWTHDLPLISGSGSFGFLLALGLKEYLAKKEKEAEKDSDTESTEE